MLFCIVRVKITFRCITSRVNFNSFKCVTKHTLHRNHLTSVSFCYFFLNTCLVLRWICQNLYGGYCDFLSSLNTTRLPSCFGDLRRFKHQIGCSRQNPNGEPISLKYNFKIQQKKLFSSFLFKDTHCHPYTMFNLSISTFVT